MEVPELIQTENTERRGNLQIAASKYLLQAQLWKLECAPFLFYFYTLGWYSLLDRSCCPT